MLKAFLMAGGYTKIYQEILLESETLKWVRESKKPGGQMENSGAKQNTKTT